MRSLRSEGVIEEDLVDDEGEIELAAKARQFGCFPLLGEVAGGVVGVNDDDGARAGRDGAAYGFRVDLPAVVEDEREGNEPDVVEGGEEVEERVAGMGNQNFGAGVAEKAEEKAVGLAGAGGEKDVGTVEVDSVAGVVGADGLARPKMATGLGIVIEDRG